MLPDFFMLLFASAIGTLIIGFGFSWVAENTHNSKFAMAVFVGGVIILMYMSIHEHNCKKDYVLECNQAHALNLTYNYCEQKVLYPNDTADFNIDCFYHPRVDCKTLPDGCINKEYKNIDGLCIPFTPICFLFNKPSVAKLNFTYIKSAINWSELNQTQNKEENKTMIYYNETYIKLVFNFSTRMYDKVNFTVVKNKTA
jgi:hypothetical protein